MLEHTFCHIPKIGPKSEEKLWNQGFTTWHALLTNSGKTLHSKQLARLCPFLEQSKAALLNQQVDFFGRCLPSAQIWRLFGTFAEDVTYLDIETTGLSAEYGHITTIAIYDRCKGLRYYVHGENLDRFPDEVPDIRILVTYNGKQFDIPFINKYFGINLSVPNIDLRFVLSSLGMKGGLKSCELQAGMSRTEHAGLDGADAIWLWNAWIRRRDKRFLNTLLSYNIQDTLNLERLMQYAYNEKIKQTPFSDERVHFTPIPENPIHPSRELFE